MSRASDNNNLMEYEVSYKETCFAIWYNAGRPSTDRLLGMLPPDDIYNKTPSKSTLESWKTMFFWNDRAAGIDAQVQENTDRNLVKRRMDMMEKHAEMAADIASKAYDFLKDGEFDSSAAAVNAFFKAMDAEKASRGMAGALTKIFSLSDDDLKKEFDRLLTKTTDVGSDEDVVDGEVDDGVQATEETNG